MSQLSSAARLLLAIAVPVALASPACLAAAEPAPGFTSPTAVAPDVQQVAWDLRMPKDGPVPVSGEVSFDTAGTGAGNMMYPAPGVAGLLIAIAVHGAVESAAKKAQKAKMEEQANQILAPYKGVLDGYRIRALMQDAVARQPFGTGKKLLDQGQGAGADWVIESTPSFVITQDQHAFFLDNAITIYAPSSPTVPLYRNVVRAVSRSRPAETAPFWTANQGEQLKGEFADLYAMSVDVALQALADGPKDTGNPFRTIRYMEGSTERIERGQVLHEQCNRVVIKTLRGTLMSLPVQPADPAAQPAVGCDDAKPAPASTATTAHA